MNKQNGKLILKSGEGFSSSLIKHQIKEWSHVNNSFVVLVISLAKYKAPVYEEYEEQERFIFINQR